MNLNDFLASNVDAIDWRRAAFGDVIMYLDPEQRELHGWAWQIDGVPSYDHRANLIAWTKRIDDQAIPQMRSTPVQREFSPTMFQVWRKFPSPIERANRSLDQLFGQATIIVEDIDHS